MAWTSPVTWVSQAVTAALLNQQLRDNMNETAPGVASAAGRFFVADAANSIVERIPTTAKVATSESISSTTFGNMATQGPSVTVTTGTTALVIVSASMAHATAGNQSIVGYEITGATTKSAGDADALSYESSVANDQMQATWSTLRTDLTAGSNTFKLLYRASISGTSTFKNRNITVIPF